MRSVCCSSPQSHSKLSFIVKSHTNGHYSLLHSHCLRYWRCSTCLCSRYFFSGSPTECPTSFSKPSGDAPAPTDMPQDGTAGSLGCPPYFSASGLPDAVRESLIEWTENLPPSQRPSGFPPVQSADGSVPTDIPGDAFDKSLAPSQSDIPPTVRKAFV